MHVNVKLITCKYNANDMQTSTGFLWVHSSGILFLGLRIGANLHPVPFPLPCFFIINIFRGRTQGLTWYGGEKAKVGVVLWAPWKRGRPPLRIVASGKLTCLIDSEGAE